MIKFLKYSEIDFEKYENCLVNSYQNSDFAERNFLNIVSNKQWFLLVQGDYEAVMPVAYVRKFGIPFVVIPKFCQQLGIFSEVDNATINDLFYEYLTDNFLVASYAFNAENKFSKAISQKTSFILKKNNYEDVKKNYSTNRRRNVRITDDLAEKMVFKNELNTEVESFFKKYMKGSKNEKDRRDFFKIFEHLFTENMGKLRILNFEKNIQSLVYLYEGRKNNYLSLFINAEPLANPNSPSLIIDRCLQEFITNKNFDFVGSDLENIAKFNQRFGAVAYKYSIITHSKFTLFKKLLTSYRIISNFAL